MFTVDASRIRTLMFEKGINGVTELARQAQINAATATKVLKDGTKVTIRTLGTLAKFFNVNGDELILKE